MHRFIKILTIASFALLVACAQMFPAASKQIAPGVYELVATGNSFATREQLQSKIDKKATKLCGEKNYEYQGLGDYKLNKQKNYTSGGGYTSTHYFQLKTTIKCNTQKVPIK